MRVRPSVKLLNLLESSAGLHWLTVVACVCVVDDRTSLQSDSSQSTLTINKAESTDTGCYSVQLVNIHGSERMYSSVTIEGTSRLVLRFTHQRLSSFVFAESTNLNLVFIAVLFLVNRVK